MKQTNSRIKKRRYLPEEQRRRDILRAAIQVFTEKGYHKAKMQDIASLAGVANGTVYRYYPSKRALATEIIGSRGATGFINSLKEGQYKNMAPEEFLRSIGQRYFGNLEERLPLIRFRTSEAISNIEVARDYYQNLLQRLFTHLSDFVTEWQKKGVFKQGDPFILGLAFYGMLFGFLYTQELIFGKEFRRISFDEVTKLVVDLYLHGIEADQETGRQA